MREKCDDDSNDSDDIESVGDGYVESSAVCRNKMDGKIEKNNYNATDMPSALANALSASLLGTSSNEKRLKDERDKQQISRSKAKIGSSTLESDDEMK